MSGDDIKKEIEQQVMGTMHSVRKEVKNYIVGFYISIVSMILCLVIGFYIGSSQTNSTGKMVYHTQRKVDLMMDHFGIKYNGK